MELGSIERNGELGRLAALYDGGARAALVVGTAGAGKAALVGELLRRRPASPLCGRCVAGALPYEPFRQMGYAAGGAAQAREGLGWEARRAAEFADVAAWLRARAPGLVVVERLDLADRATRDLVGWLLTLAEAPRFLFTSRGDEPWLAPVARVVLDGAHEGAPRREPAGEATVDAALTAGERFEQACAFDLAIAAYREAAARTTRSEVVARLDERLCALLRTVGDFGAARTHAERLRTHAPADAVAHRRVAELFLLEDRAADALATADAALALTPSADERARLHAVRAEALYALGRLDDARAVTVAGAAVDVALQLGNTHAKALLAAGEYAAAAAQFAAQAETARAAARPSDECRALMNRGIAELRLGDRAGAAARYQAALALAEAAGDLRNRAFCLQNLGVLAHFQHDYATALARFSSALSAFAQLGQRARVAWVALDLASVYVDLNDAAAAEASLSCAAVAEAPAVIAVDRAQLAGRIAWRRGEHAAARAHLDDALARALAAGDHDRAVDARLALARVALDAGDPDTAARVLAAVNTPSSPAAQARARLLSGEVAAARRDASAARTAFAAALAAAGRADDLDVALRAQVGLGRHEAARELDRQLRARVPAAHQAAFAADPLRARLYAGHAPPLAAPATPTVAPTPTPTPRPRLIGRHPRMLELLRLVDKIAPHESVVLIRGASGTGKELVADALHAASPRRNKPLVKLNCAALVESLLLSELFGHERGAFTGAVAKKRGLVEAADGATLFLDEVGELSPKSQVALLRVLSDGDFVRVGGTQPIRVDVRVLCATNRDLDAMVARGTFRQDLYYRLKGIVVELPPLRERVADIPLLCDALLDRFAAERKAERRTLSPEALTMLCRHPWPGNVRELENVIRAVSLFADGPLIGGKELADYTEVFRSADARPAAGSAWQRLDTEKLSLKALKTRIEIECIAEALARAGGNITRAASLLGMKRPRLSQLIKEHGIAVGEQR
jgi:DNA-binding NtrC family response regulator